MLASRSSFDSNPQALGALPDLLQCHFKSSQLFRARIGKDFSNFGCVFAKNRRDQSFPFWRERHDADAPILSTLDPAHQAPFDEALNGRADRAGRKVHLWPDRIHRQGPFIEECFQYPEVGIIDSRLLKTCIQIFRSRLEGLPQYQPTVNQVWRLIVHDKTILTLCITNVYKNESVSIGLASMDMTPEWLGHGYAALRHFTTGCTCEGGQNENRFTYRSLLARVDLFGFGAQWFPQLSSHAWAYRNRGSILWRNLCFALLCSHLSSSDRACPAVAGQPLRSSGAHDTRSDYLQYRLHSRIHGPCWLAPGCVCSRPLSLGGVFGSISVLRNLRGGDRKRRRTKCAIHLNHRALLPSKRRSHRRPSTSYFTKRGPTPRGSPNPCQ